MDVHGTCSGGHRQGIAKARQLYRLPVRLRRRTACTAGRFVRPGALLGDHRRHLCHLLLHPGQLLGKGAVLPHPLAHLLNAFKVHHFQCRKGGIGIVRSANKVRKNPLRVILNGLGKDSGYTLARFNGFTYMETTFDHAAQTLKVLGEKAFSHGERANVKVYCNSSVEEAIEVMKLEHVDVSITGNSANAIRFQHLVAGSYKKWCVAHGVKYFSVASGGGTGRTLHPDNMAAGPASYGMTDTMGRMHGDAQFAGSSSVPAHVEMMGFLGMGNNPMVGATVAVAVAIEEAMKK